MNISKAELRVLQLLVRGHMNKEIASDLLISEKTVKNHLSNIFKKLGVQNRTTAIIRSLEKGIINLKEIKMKKVVVAVLLLGCLGTAKADLTWDTGKYGVIGLPFTATESVVGYDALGKQAIAGLSLPVYTSPKNILVANVGAVGAWPTSGDVVQPYLSVGHDILPELSGILGLPQYTSAHLNVFSRYDATNGKAGLGVSFSYSPF